MKFLVLSLLVAVASAVPNTYSNYQSSSSYGGYQPAARYGASYSSYGASAAPRLALISLGGLGGGFGSGYSSGISSGLTGGFSGFGNAGYSAGYAAPAATTYQLVPVQAAAQTVAIQSAPVATVALAQAAPVSFGSYGQASGYRQAQASTFSGLSQHRSDSFESVVPAAINQVARTVEYVNVPHNEQAAQAQVVEVEPSDNPVHLHFKTRSSTLSVSQSHTPGQPTEAKHESAQDEPQRLSIEVNKPVIQEVKETITPFRQVTQEIHPVQESLHTIVSKGEQRQQYAQQANYGQQYAQQQVNYAQVAAPVATVAAVQPVQATFAVQAAPAIQTVAVQPVQVAALESANYVQAAPVASHYQSANYVQAAPSVATIAFQSSPVVSSSGHYQSGSSGLSSFGSGSSFGSQGARFHSTPLSSGSSSSFSSSSSSSYKPISSFKKNDY